MLYFIILLVGIILYKIARKIQWEEYIIRKRKERRVEWIKKQKGKSYGKKTYRRNKPPKRKKRRN